MDDQAFREAATSAVDEIIRYYDTLADRPVVSSVQPGYLRKLLPAEAPEKGEPWGDIQKDVEDKIVPGLTHWQSPNFFAFFPCPASYPSILGELYSATFAAAAFNWICSPAITELETVVLDWLGRLLGLPAEFLSTGPTRGGGVIHGTASEAVMTMMTAAADKYLRTVLEAELQGKSAEEQEDIRSLRRTRLVALGSAAAHSSTKKAAQVLGLRFRSVPARAEDGYLMTGQGLAATVAAVRKAGLEPFFLTATFGTTDTCAVDDFAGIADVLAADHAAHADKGEIWVHIDGAFAGSALVLPAQQALFTPGPTKQGTSILTKFHSFNTNMHKWLLTNFDCSCVFVRDRSWLVNALGADAHYYRNDYSDGGLVTDYRDWQIPLGRRFRALKVWFVLRTYGAEGLRAYITKSLAMGDTFFEAIKGRPDLFEIVTGPRFSLTVFRSAPLSASEPAEATSARTRRIADAVNATGKVWVTATNLEAAGAAIRFMTGNYRTEQKHVDAAIALIIETAEKITKEDKEAASKSA